MKKILCILFGIMTFVSTGRSNGFRIVSDINDLDKPINMMAVLEAFKDTQNQCARIDTNNRNKISNKLSMVMLSSPDTKIITVKGVILACISATNESALCYDCMDAIITQHNEILRIKTTSMPEYTSKEQYERALKIRGGCTKENVNMDFHIFVEPDPYEFNIDEAIEECKRVAIKKACILEELWKRYDTTDYEEYICGAGRESSEDDYRQIPINFTPTWEDYKNLNNIK